MEALTDLLTPEDADELRQTFASVEQEVRDHRDFIGRGWRAAKERELFEWDLQLPDLLL